MNEERLKSIAISVTITLFLLVLAGLCYRVEMDSVKQRVEVLEQKNK